MTASESRPSNSEQVLRGASWLYSLRWVDRLLGLASLTLLARALNEQDFGMVMIAASYVLIIEGLSQFDINRALIQSPDVDRSTLDSGWTLSVIRGLAAALVLLVVAALQSDPRMQELIFVLALAPVLDGFVNPKFTLFERALEFSKAAQVGLAAKLISVIATIAVLLLAPSYWAVVVGILTNSAVVLVLSYTAAPYGPKISFVRARNILSFSGWMSLSNILTTLSMNTDRLIVGHLTSVGSAGLYAMTQRISSLPTAELMSPLQRVLFPSFRQLSNDSERLRGAVLESVNVMGTLSLSASFGFASVAHDFVPLVLGDRWSVIVPLMHILVPYLGVRATLAMAHPCAMALGQTRLLFKVSLIYAVVHLPVFIGATWLFGLPGAIAGIVVAGVAYVGLSAWILRRTVALRLADIASQLRRPLFAALAMVLAIWAAGPVLTRLGISEASWAHLGCEVSLGLLIYTATLAVQWHLEGQPAGLERRLWGIVRSRLLVSK